MRKKVVILGGGTGLSTILKGLKLFPIDITAIVSVADNGSSTGRLRDEFHIPAIGDLRQVLVALSESEPLLEQLLQYRFETTSDLNGHPVGNLLLTALFNINGNLVDAIASLGKVLNLKGQVLPLSEELVTLVAYTKDGEKIVGESNITKCGKPIDYIAYQKEPKIVGGILKALKEADLIIFSTGSLYTSIIPNLICKEVVEAIKKSTAKKIYICNMMTEHGETDNFTVGDHLKIINQYLGSNLIDAVIANSKYIDINIQEKYLSLEQSTPVLIDKEKVEELGAELIADNLAVIQNDTVRHDSLRTAFLIFSYILR